MIVTRSAIPVNSRYWSVWFLSILEVQIVTSETTPPKDLKKSSDQCSMIESLPPAFSILDLKNGRKNIVIEEGVAF